MRVLLRRCPGLLRLRAYAAHFALTYLFWLLTYLAAGYLAREIGTPLTFTAAGVLCLILVLVARAIRGGHRSHGLVATE